MEPGERNSGPAGEYGPFPAVRAVDPNNVNFSKVECTTRITHRELRDVIIVGATKVVTDETFEAEVLKSDKPVIVDYWAEWCGPCRMVAPILEEIATEYADKLDVVKLNIDENPAVSQRYGIMAIPTMNVFAGGEVVKQIVGAKPKSALLRELADFI
jgi:thioredoxin 1